MKGCPLGICDHVVCPHCKGPVQHGFVGGSLAVFCFRCNKNLFLSQKLPGEGRKAAIEEVRREILQTLPKAPDEEQNVNVQENPR